VDHNTQFPCDGISEVSKRVLTWFSQNGSSIVETELQVSELVTGFTEQRSPSKETHVYNQASPYYQRSLNRFFRTTGVCLHLPQINISGDGEHILLETFCGEFGVQERDVGLGDFHTKVDVSGRAGTQKGTCIFDATNGSLRLTQQFVMNLPAVVKLAVELARRRDNNSAASQLDPLLRIAESFERRTVVSEEPELFQGESDGWLEVIARGEKGIYAGDNGNMLEVEVTAIRWTPKWRCLRH